MNFKELLKNDLDNTYKTSKLSESMGEEGRTKVFKGNDVIGPHYHTYILFSTASGNGMTSSPIEVEQKVEDPKDRVPVYSHTHMIVNGKILDALYEHTHDFDEKSREIKNSPEFNKDKELSADFAI